MFGVERKENEGTSFNVFWSLLFLPVVFLAGLISVPLTPVLKRRQLRKERRFIDDLTRKRRTIDCSYIGDSPDTKVLVEFGAKSSRFWRVPSAAVQEEYPSLISPTGEGTLILGVTAKSVAGWLDQGIQPAVVDFHGRPLALEEQKEILQLFVNASNRAN